MIAIQTKHLGATNHRPSRVKATSMETGPDGCRRSVTLNWDNALDVADNHMAAARMYVENCTLLDVDNFNMHSGSCDGGWVFVLVRK